jgi:hypothetical protein
MDLAKHGTVLRVLKGIAAGLSAKHNVTVRFSREDACATDGKTIVIPYRDETDPLKYLGFLAHESGHIIFTDFNAIVEMVEGTQDKVEHPEFLKNIHNALEDIYIEREITTEYEGFKHFLTQIVEETNREKAKHFGKMGKTKMLLDVMYLMGRKYDYSIYPKEIVSYIETKLKHIVNKVANQCSNTREVIECAREAYEIIIKDFEIPQNIVVQIEGEDGKEVAKNLKNFLEKLKKEAGDKETQEKIDSICEECQKIIDQTAEEKEIDKNTEIPPMFEPVPRDHNVDKDQTAVRPDIGDKQMFDDLESGVHNEVKYIRNQLIRILSDVRATKWKAEEETGRRLGKHLYKIEKGDLSIFRKKIVSTNHELPEMAWYILIDHSGSMGSFYIRQSGNSKSAEACRAAIAFSELADRLELPFAITGFNEGGLYCSTFGYDRNDVHHIIYKTFDEPYYKVKVSLTEITGSGSNLDSVSLRFAYNQIKQRREPIKVIIMICDGYPCCPEGELEGIIAEIERSKDTNVVGVGIQTDAVKNFYRRYVEVNQVEELGMNIVRILADAISDLQKTVR